MQLLHDVTDSAHKAWLWPCCLCRSFRRFDLKLHQRWDSASREKAAAYHSYLFLGSHGLCAFVLNTCQVRDKRTYSSWWVWLILCFTLFSTAAWKWLKRQRTGKHSGSAFELGMDCTQTACCWDSMDHFLPSFSWLRISCESCFPHSEALHSYMSYVTCSIWVCLKIG